MRCVSPQPDVQSFYTLATADLSTARCDGTACFVARHRNLDYNSAHAVELPRVYCLGQCFAAPAIGCDDRRPHIEVRSGTGVVLERIAKGSGHTFDAFQREHGLKGLQTALAVAPEKVIDELERSELRGRGGAGFSTATKWRTVAAQNAVEKFVVANLDEGDPGAYIDRYIAEDDPFTLLEGMAIAAHAVGARHGWIYVRKEYSTAVQRLKWAVSQARDNRLLGADVLDSDLAFDIEVVVGNGSYLCGEETALLHSIEGARPVARQRPPYVAELGLWGKPTLVNNVETLANVPWILRNGGLAYTDLGIPGSRGTKVVSLNSLFRRPGLYEIEFGIPLFKLVEEVGGGLDGGALRGLMIGGPLAGVVPPNLLDTRFGFGELEAIGSNVGHGGVIAFDEHTSIAELVHHVFAFGAYESCGNCTPCRLGTRQIEELFGRIAAGEAASRDDEREWREIVVALSQASLCGFGRGLAEFADSILKYYPLELRQCFA